MNLNPEKLSVINLQAGLGSLILQGILGSQNWRSSRKWDAVPNGQLQIYLRSFLLYSVSMSKYHTTSINNIGANNNNNNIDSFICT